VLLLCCSVLQLHSPLMEILKSLQAPKLTMETFYRADFSKVQLVARADYGECKIIRLFCRISSLL